MGILRLNLKLKRRSARLQFKFVLLILPAIIFGLLQGCETASKNKSSDRSTAQESNSSSSMELTFNPAMDNSSETLKKPYLILVSIDGYRHDYNQKFQPPNLSRLQKEGVAAESLRPVYPSKTFPNHYTLVTGLTAEHHGIVSNEFYDSARNASYALNNVKTVEDGTWYFGEPLWVTAEKEGMRTATYFWVGSEADIQGIHPNEYYRYDDSISYDKRVEQVGLWLKETDLKRPHFITIYFEGVDAAAHRYGINSPEEREAVRKVDASIGQLREEIKASGLPVNLVIVSDHGMQELDPKKVLVLDETPAAARSLAKFQSFGRGPQMLLYLNQGEDPSVILDTQKILNRIPHCHVWRRDQMAHMGYAATPRVGDLIVDPEEPYIVGLRAHMPSASGANHGWDATKNKNMHGIFYAVGPSFSEHTKLPTFDNVDVYPLLLEALQLKQRIPIDGTIEPVRAALKKREAAGSASH